jgi:tetratricopeptide (TPR) repeat protein
MRPSQWIENLWYIGRCYIEKKNYDKAVEYLKQAVSIEPDDDSEKEALEASQALLKKYAK